MEKHFNICILAGEPSGERYGAALSVAFKKIFPSVQLTGIGGPHMADAGVKLIATVQSLSVMGFSGVVKSFARIYQIRRSVIRHIRRTKPNALILIDFPDFNLSIAKSVFRWKQRQHPSLKIFYYIPPQIWIWRPSRLQSIKKYCDAAFPVFEFEQVLYRENQVPSYFFGHPVTDFFTKQYDQKLTEKQESRMTVALFPGSRRQEVIKILPVMLESVEKFRTSFPDLHITVGISENVELNLYKNRIGSTDEIILSGDIHGLLANADLILSKSGTVNLEIAYFEKPAVIIYKTSWFNYRIAKWLVRPRFISLINIIAGSEVVREFIQGYATVSAIVEEMNRIQNDKNYRDTMITKLRNVKKILTAGKGPVAENVAATIGRIIAQLP